jgi:hypothetical protein
MGWIGRASRVAVVALVVATAAPVGAWGASAKNASGMWQRVAFSRSGFGARGTPEAIRAGGPGFIATGIVLDRDRRDSSPAIWTSTDGSHWSLVPRRDAALNRKDVLTGLASRRGVTIAATARGKIIRSRDGRHWRRSGELRGARRRAFTSHLVLPGPHGFVALEPATTATWNIPTWTSSDGRRWTKSIAVGSEQHPVGLFPRTPFRDHWLTTRSTALDDTSEPRAVYSSTDGVRWNKVSDAPAVQPLGQQIRSTRSRSSVLAIQYEQAPASDGHLWTSHDAINWREIASFHAAMPNGAPDHVVRSGRWWVLGGITGPKPQHSDMWASPDLHRWYEMPKDLRGGYRSDAEVSVIAGRHRVLGFAGPTNKRGAKVQLWIWRPPT